MSGLESPLRHTIMKTVVKYRICHAACHASVVFFVRPYLSRHSALRGMSKSACHA